MTARTSVLVRLLVPLKFAVRKGSVVPSPALPDWANIKQTPAGTFKAQVRRAGFPAQIQTFQTTNEATEWAARVEQDMKDGHFVPIDRDGQTMTLVKLFERYKKHQQKEGVAIERGALSCFTLIEKSNLANIPISRLTPNGITKFAETRRLTVKPQTVATNLSRLSMVINFANDHLGLQITNPVREVHKTLRTRKIVSKSQERKRRPTADELTALRTHFAEPGKSRPRRVPMVDIIDFAIATTMRAGEITSIRWSDLNEERREIMIRARKIRWCR